MKRFALVGNPNSGKTTLFNSLTGSTAHVGNWPGVTVDKKEGTYKKCKELIQIVDLPGIYSLSPYTAEEVISRNFIIDEKPECVINIVDATNLERNLYLTTQLLEMDVPVIIALNMMDVVQKNGDKIDCAILERQIGVPVVAISAQKGDNIEELMERAYVTSEIKREGTSVLEASSLSHLIKDVTTAFKGLEVDSPVFHAVKLVENDDIEVKNHPKLVNIVDEFKKSFKDATFGNDLEAIVADARYQYITTNYTKALTRAVKADEFELTKSDKIDRVLTNKWAGLPIFLVILFTVFHLTFSENLFYLGGLFNNVAPSFEGSMFEGLLWTDAGINSPGVMLFNLMDCITAGIGDLVAGWTESWPGWVSGLINDGVLAGVFGVLSFVPQILLLFLFFSILEDSGYMARVAFILDRIFRRFGLSGRAFMPMIMGFGCSVPAMINTRTLADENEKISTIRVIPFFSCGAKLPILTAIAGAICTKIGLDNADIITYSMYLLGIITAIVTVLIMRHTTMRGDTPPFIMELPTYHMPQFKSLMVHLWDKLKHYVEKAFTIILASTIVIWFLTNFGWDWQMTENMDES
ncbi:MAG: ferrous iron transport protein B, partial [Acholeplasmatales bacterium]|nr:ferrous iron transport protein B [Acholeplasmatales bacterium]